MCIGDATAQQTRRELYSSVVRAASIGLSTTPSFTFPRWNFPITTLLAPQSPFLSRRLVREVMLMSLGTILVIILILVLLGVIPSWGYSNSWGYGPSGIVGTILVIVLILLLLGRI
jgi:sterol desaturase/sphingolipid hydroxylase (fatty acid hydroxylase superfamily)